MRTELRGGGSDKIYDTESTALVNDVWLSADALLGVHQLDGSSPGRGAKPALRGDQSTGTGAASGRR